MSMIVIVWNSARWLTLPALPANGKGGKQGSQVRLRAELVDASRATVASAALSLESVSTAHTEIALSAPGALSKGRVGARSAGMRGAGDLVVGGELDEGGELVVPFSPSAPSYPFSPSDSNSNNNSNEALVAVSLSSSSSTRRSADEETEGASAAPMADCGGGGGALGRVGRVRQASF
ncbi:hypothetical protein T492DRAFT_849381 [Pavlovales sp. CCMP2436]|nr:hypothetical protein T492DRAFT_849381 [Pavlovales sp. CCMP2436]